MSGPSLFDDFFSEEEQDDASAHADQENYESQRSITDIKKQLIKENEEKEYSKLSEEEFSHSSEEASPNLEEKQEKEENLVSDAESGHLLEEPEEKKGIFIEWTEPSESQEQEIKDTPAFHIELPTSPSVAPEDILISTSEPASNHTQPEPLDSEPITFIENEVIEEKELSAPTEKSSSSMVFFEMPEPIEEEIITPPIIDNTDTKEEVVIDTERLDMLSEHFDAPGLTAEELSESRDELEVDEVTEMPSIQKTSIDEAEEKHLLARDIPEEATHFDVDEDIEANIPKHISESTLPSWDLEDKYYPIGEVAKLFEVNLSHIRYWTNEFKLKPRTTRRGERLYTTADIQKLRMIYFLVKEQKHTIEGAKKHLKENASVVADQIHLRNSLIQFKEQLQRIVDQL